MNYEERKVAREMCEYCQWEILPGQKVFASRGTTWPLFDRMECVEADKKEHSLEFEVEEIVYDPMIM